MRKGIENIPKLRQVKSDQKSQADPGQEYSIGPFDQMGFYFLALKGALKYSTQMILLIAREYIHMKHYL